MTTPRTAADLLSQRPHTTLPADADDEPDDDDDEEDYQDYPEWGGGALPDEEDQDQDEEQEPWYKEAAEQYSELLEDADEHQLKLTDYQRYSRRLKESLLNQVYNIWKAAGPTRQAAAQVGTWVQSAQETQSYLTQMYADRNMGAEFNVFHPGPGILERPSASKLDLYSRPIRERSLGAQLSRLSTLAVTDLQLAKTRTLYSAFDEDQRVNRHPIKTYKRVTESEKPCALCIIASDQVYFTTDLMPIHDNCECDVELADEEDLDEHKARYHHIGWVKSLLATGDKYDTIKTLADQDADASEYHNLVAIRHHGDLGPVLTWSDQKFTGPGDLPVPRPVRPVPTVSGAGPGHEARLQRNAARVAQQRRQKGHVLHYAEGHGGITTYLPPTPKVTRPIPKPDKPLVWDRPVIPFRPKQPKPIDFEHDSFSEMFSAVANKHSVRAGFDRSWDDPQFNEIAKRRVLQAVDEMLTKYPDVKIGRIGIADLHADSVWAETTAERAGTGTESVVFNSHFMSQTPEELLPQYRRNQKSGWFFSSTTENPWRAVTIHEYGHVLGNRGYRRANKNVPVKMLELFDKSGRGEPRPVPHVIDKTASLRDQNKALVRNIDEREAWIKRNEQAMSDWLAEKDRVSGYSMVDQAIPGKPSLLTGRPGRVQMNPGEALAEAFAHVEIDPEGARELPKALHDMVVEEARQPRPAVTDEIGRAAMRIPKESAVERLRQMTEPKPDWTPVQMAKEDNFTKNKAEQVILSDEQRTLARQLATKLWIEGAKVEPAITAAAQSSVETQGGFMSGLDYRKKTGPSLYRKIQADAIEMANGAPVTNELIEVAAKDIKDAVRYTAIFPQEGYWDKGTQLQHALSTLGAKTIKDPVGLPLEGYRGRNFAFELDGMPFEMQVNTELGVAIKDEAHQIYNKSRKLKNALEAKGVDPLTDPAYQKMMDDMQAKWDTIPMPEGTPIVATEQDVKSRDKSKILYWTDHTEYQGRTVPNGHAALGSPEMLSRERVPSTQYGMDWLPDSPETKIVAPARTLTDDDWNTLPVQMLPQGTPLKANEGTLKKKSIDKVVSGNEPFREGYYIKLLRTYDKDGKPVLHIVDGHTRVAMYHALGKDMPVRIMDQSMVDDLQSEDIYDLAKANDGITIDLGGHQPEDGYAYAPDKTTETKIAADKFTQKHVEDFIEKHRALLMKEGNNFGCWYEDGYYYLDVSRVGDASAETIEEAQKNEQLGIFDLKTFGTINIGKIDAQGRYRRLDEATSIHNRHQEQIARDAESRSAASDSEVSGLGSGGAGPAVERAVAPPAKLWDHLADDEENAVKFYVGGDYEGDGNAYNLNAVLRQRPEWVKPDNEYGQQVAAIDSALKKSSLDKPVKVQRIISGQSRDLRREILDHASDPAYRITDPAFMSTSRVVRGRNLAEDFDYYATAFGGPSSKPDISKGIVLQMDLPKGAHALDVGAGLANASGNLHQLGNREREILLPRDSQWRIDHVTTDRASGLPIVHLKPVTSEVRAVPKRKRREVIRVGAGGDFTPPHNLIPPGGKLPDGVKWLDQKKMVANIVARYDDCVGDNAWIKQAGLQWYPGAHDWVAKLLANSGKPWTFEKAAAIVAQFSENASWSANMMRATNYFNGIRRGAFKATFKRADAIADSDDPMTAMRGPKINNFGHAILGDDPNAVAIDRWAARIALGTTDKAGTDKIKGRVGGYEALKAAYVEAARQLGISPRDLQAITWVHAVPPDATVEEFEETGHWNFHD